MTATVPSTLHGVCGCRRIYRGNGKGATKREVHARSSWTGLPLSTWSGNPQDNTVIPVSKSYEEVKECLENNTLPAEVQEVNAYHCSHTALYGTRTVLNMRCAVGSGRH